MMTLCLIFSACYKNNKNTHCEMSNLSYSVDKVKVDNHDYIIATVNTAYGGISIIHSESCECKKINNKNIK